ncbi:hypothetical protein Tco_0583061 [Tanacetum coccineum]
MVVAHRDVEGGDDGGKERVVVSAVGGNHGGGGVEAAGMEVVLWGCEMAIMMMRWLSFDGDEVMVELMWRMWIRLGKLTNDLKCDNHGLSRSWKRVKIKYRTMIIREVFVKLLLDSFGKLSIRVDVRTYLLGGAIDSSEANGIIRDPKLELESSRFTFDLVPLSYESVDVVVGENWLLRHKAEMVCHEKVVKMPCVPKELVGFTPRRRIGFRMELVQGATPICEGSCRLTSLERQEVWNDCRSCKVRVGSNGNLLWEASVLLGRKKGGVRVAREDDRGVTEGREDVREVFQQRGSGAKRKLSRCGRNQMGNEPILALPEGADDFVVYYDARSKDLEACLEKGEGDCLTLAIKEAYTTKYSIHPGADTMLCGFRLTNRWLSIKKDIASCGSKYLAYLEVEVEYQGSSRLLLQPELPE